MKFLLTNVTVMAMDDVRLFAHFQGTNLVLHMNCLGAVNGA